jgi:hypothetical protein
MKPIVLKELAETVRAVLDEGHSPRTHLPKEKL